MNHLRFRNDVIDILENRGYTKEQLYCRIKKLPGYSDLSVFEYSCEIDEMYRCGQIAWDGFIWMSIEEYKSKHCGLAENRIKDMTNLIWNN